MRTDLFDFTLPESLIATRPARPRDAARMLVVGEGLEDRLVRDLPDYLRAGDVLVVNDTRVMPARLFGLRGGVRVEVLLHKRLSSPVIATLSGAKGKQSSDGSPRLLTQPRDDDNLWLAFARPGKRLRVGDVIAFEGFSASVEEKRESGEVVLQFPRAQQAIAALGQMPLPPYIAQLRGADAQDAQDYQTIYARESGSVAAPTAGLHFTSALLDAVAAAGVARVAVTLHVGGGTFLPVKTDDTDAHRMHAETAQVTPQAAAAINAAKAQGGRVIAVGTTSLRTLESASDEEGVIHPFRGETDIFITPGYRFKAVDALLTNFHLPRSTLFMLVCAFAGCERMQAAYAHAIAQHYRFYSYGDACLLGL